MATDPGSDKIAETLFGKTRRRVLGLIYGRPDESFYLRQVVRLTDAGVGPVQRELKALTGAGLVTREKQGKQVYFQANPDSPVFDDLRRLIEKTTGLADQVRAALVPFEHEGTVQHAFLFGSVASGTQSSVSDVDVMVIGNVKLSEVAPALRPVQDLVAREINPSVYRLDEFVRRVAAGDHFISSVMQGPRMTLVGSDDELAGLVRQSLAD